MCIEDETSSWFLCCQITVKMSCYNTGQTLYDAAFINPNYELFAYSLGKAHIILAKYIIWVIHGSKLNVYMPSV